MNAIRLLAKLTARGVAIGGAGGGRVEVAGTDVAAAIAFAGVGRTADRLIRFLYCGDVCQEPLLQAALVHELRGKVAAERLLLGRLVRLALVELASRSVCKTCGGSGYVAASLCEVCGGGGLKPFSQRMRADMIGVSQPSFHRHYEEPANQVYQYVAALANDAMARVAGQFTDRAA